MFLRARKYKVQAAFQVVQNFNKFWLDPENASLIEGLTGANSCAILQTHMMRPLSGLDRLGNMLVALDMGGLDWSKVNYADQMKFSIYNLCALAEDVNAQLHGVTYVETFKGFSLSAAAGARKYMDSDQQKKIFRLVTDTFPIRIRRIHVVEPPWYFKMFWTICKPFLKAKMVAKMNLISGKPEEWHKKLHEHIDPANLPPEFGGTLNEPFEAAVHRIHAIEAATGQLGGFAFPLSVRDPTGALRSTGGAAGGPASAVASPASGFSSLASPESTDDLVG